MRFVPAIRRILPTTSWDVQPTGLSTTITPSIVLTGNNTERLLRSRADHKKRWSILRRSAPSLHLRNYVLDDCAYDAEAIGAEFVHGILFVVPPGIVGAVIEVDDVDRFDTGPNNSWWHNEKDS